MGCSVCFFSDWTEHSQSPSFVLRDSLSIDAGELLFYCFFCRSKWTRCLINHNVRNQTGSRIV